MEEAVVNDVVKGHGVAGMEVGRATDPDDGYDVVMARFTLSDGTATKWLMFSQPDAADLCKMLARQLEGIFRGTTRN